MDDFTKDDKKYVLEHIKNTIMGALVGTSVVVVMGICAHFGRLLQPWHSVSKDYSLDKRFEVAYNPKIDRYAKENMYSYRSHPFGTHKKSKIVYNTYTGPALVYTLHGIFLVGGACLGLFQSEEMRDSMFRRRRQKTY